MTGGWDFEEFRRKMQPPCTFHGECRSILQKFHRTVIINFSLSSGEAFLRWGIFFPFLWLIEFPLSAQKLYDFIAQDHDEVILCFFGKEQRNSGFRCFEENQHGTLLDVPSRGKWSEFVASKSHVIVFPCYCHWEKQDCNVFRYIYTYILVPRTWETKSLV